MSFHWIFSTLYRYVADILKMCMKKFDTEKIFFDKLTGFFARLYVSTGRAIAVSTASVSPSVSASALLKMLKFLAKVFKSLYLLNL